MNALPYILAKEFRQIFRNPILLRMIVMLPIIQLIVLPMAADFEIKNIRISLVDHDHSPASRLLLGKIRAGDYFIINDYSDGFNHGLSEFEKGHSDIILEIPKDFGKSITLRGKASLLVAANAINGVKASVGSNYLQQIIASTSKELMRKNSMQNNSLSPQPMDLRPIYKYNPHMYYPLFMVPGILVFLVSMIGIYMCALNIVKEKESGTIEQINVTPVKKTAFILGKLIPFWVIGMIVFSIGLLGVARLLYQIVPLGSVALLYGFLAIYLLSVLGLGLLISTYSQTQQQAMSLAFFVMMVGLLMSGLFTPTESMPEWAQWISRCNPLTYFTEVMRMVVIKGSGIKHIGKHFLVVGCMAIFFNTWAILNFRKTGN